MDLSPTSLPTQPTSTGIEKSTPASDPVSKLNRDRIATPDFKVRRPDAKLFTTPQGLTVQTGVESRLFRRLALKELTDNALDACDAAGRPGQARIKKLGDHRYLIEDEGNGIPGTPEDLAAMFSFDRDMVTSKFWRLPLRGCMGNGIRAIVGCVVLSGGMIEVTTRNQRVVLRPTRFGRTEILDTEGVDWPIGTRIVVTFGPELDEDDKDMMWAIQAIEFSKVAGSWSYSRSPSPHHFDADHFAECLSLIEPPDATVRQFVEQLDGCSGAKAGKIAEPFGKGRTCQSLNEAQAAALLRAAQAAARPIKPEALKPIGADSYPAPEWGYNKQCGTFIYGAHAPQATVPFIVEAWVHVEDRKSRETYFTLLVNRTPPVGDVQGRHVAQGKKTELRFIGAGLEYDNKLELPRGKCTIRLHITSPCIPVFSIGKQPNLRVFQDAINEATRLAFNRSIKRLPPDPEDPKPEPEAKPPRPPHHNAVVLAHLAGDVEFVSSGGKYMFSQRNLFYRTRTHVEKETGGEQLGWANFCDILTDYEEENGPIEGMIRDPRGSFHDLEDSIELGTTAVASYSRPSWQFHKVLFCEKEDHVRILQQAGWDKRHDCALMSSKGYATRAARDLIDMIADTASHEPVTVFCIHDADAAGTMIMQCLQEETRARGRRRIEIIDLGLQPWQGIDMGLPVENVSYKKRQTVSDYVRGRKDLPPAKYQQGSWDDWLQHHRIELNALTPAQLIAMLDEQVEQHGMLKVVPPGEFAALRLHSLIERKIRTQEEERILREARERIEKATADRLAEVTRKIPEDDDLRAGIEAAITSDRELHWTGHVEQMATRLAGSDAA